MRAVGVALLALVLGALVSTARAGGPLIVNGAGDPLVWGTGPVPWNPDRGALGALSNTDAVALVDDGFAVWEAVSTASITFVDAGPLAEDITAANVHAVIGVCGDGLSPIVFDVDGSITDALLGAGASQSVLGFAGPECGTYTPPVITEASAVLNGRFLDGIAAPGNPEISPTDFAGVCVHEFGHYAGLEHSQINLTEAFDGNPDNNDEIATMFPFLVDGAQAAILARDDEVALSVLYPAASFATRGRITGRVLRTDGTTPFQGAYVIARNLADPRHDAIGYTSGARYFPGSLGGPPAPELQGFYELDGLIGGASYTVEIEPIYPGFVGGSGVGPFSVPVALPGPAEFWSGPSEGGTDPPDDPTAPGVPIPVTAGATTSGIDIVINSSVVPANDACADAAVIAGFPFTDTTPTADATTAPEDPVQRCGASTTPNSDSVWYRLTAPGDGAITASVAGSTYHTVVSAYTGTCGALGPVACNDDQGGSQPALTLAVSAGTTYLLEVTAFAFAGGGTLRLAVSFDFAIPASCQAAAPGVCIPGQGSASSDCLTEWIVEPVPAVPRTKLPRKNVPPARLRCVDGDPSCDFDDFAGKNRSCRFHVAVCINNHDPRPAAAGCVPSALTSYLLQSPNSVKPRDAADASNAATLQAAVAALANPQGLTTGKLVAFTPAASSHDRCTPFQSITVPVGTRTLRSKATALVGSADSDQLRLQCVR